MNKLLLIFCLLPSVVLGQSSGLPAPIQPGVTVTGTPSTGQVPTATSSTSATWQTPSGGGSGVQYNPANTSNFFYGDSRFIVSGGCTVAGNTALAITAWSITSNVATFTVSNALTAGTVLQLTGFGTSTFFNGQNVTVLSSGLSGSQFTANLTHANGSATEAGRAQCSYAWPQQAGTRPFFSGHGVVTNYGISNGTVGDMIGNYTAQVHPFSPAVTGNPGFLFIQVGYNDVGAFCQSAGTVEGNLQTFWATAHADGWTIVQTTILVGAWNTVLCPPSPANYAAVNAWLRGQAKTSTSATGQYWDKFIDIAQVLSDNNNTLLFTGGVHLTDAGTAIAAEMTNAAMGVQGSNIQSYLNCINANGCATTGSNTFSGGQTIFASGDGLAVTDSTGSGGQWTVGNYNNGGTGIPYLRLNGTLSQNWKFISGHPFLDLVDGCFAVNGGGLGAFPVVNSPYTALCTDGTTGGWDVGNGAYQDTSGHMKMSSMTLTSLGTGTSPVCPNGTGGALTTSGCTGGTVYPAGTGVPQVVSGTSWGTTLGVQGTDSKVLTSGTISGTSAPLCTDANGGATTSGCVPTGTGIAASSALAASLSGTIYMPLAGGGLSSATEASVDVAAPGATTLSAFYVEISTALGVGNSAVFTVRKNGSNSSITCTISGASATSCNDLTHSLSVTQGDLLTTSVVPSGTVVVTPNILTSIAWPSGSGGGNTTSTALTSNFLPKANGVNSIVNSSVSDNGTSVTVAEPLILNGSTNGELNLTFTGSPAPSPPANSVQFTVDGAVATPYKVPLPTSGPTGTLKYMNCAADPCVWDAGSGGSGALVNITGVVTVSGCTVSGSQCVVGSATANVTFSSIPGGYTSIKIISTENTSDVASTSIAAQFNGDTGNNYIWQQLFSVGSTVASAGSGGLVNHVDIGPVPDNTSGNTPGSFELLIPNYSNTTFNKLLFANGVRWQSGTADLIQNYTGRWQSTAAITSIKMFSEIGGNIVSGSIFSIYGVQ